MSDIVPASDLPKTMVPASRGDIVPMHDLPHHAELPSFPIDAYVDHHVKDLAPDKAMEQRDGFTKFFSNIADPWMATGYTAASAMNRGIANMADTFDVMTKFIERETGSKRGGLFEQAAAEYNRNADYWKDRADKVGVGFLEELLGEAAGGAVPGITDFALKVASGFTIPAVVGAERSMEHDQDPFIGGLLEAAKTGTLYGVFKMIQPFSRYIQATMMGGTFALEGAMTAPEGQKLKEAAKGFGTGLLFSSLSTPGGVKIRDLYPEIARSVPEMRKEFEAEEQLRVAPIVQPEPTSEVKTVYRASDKPFDKALATEDGIFVVPDKMLAEGYSEGGKRKVEELLLDKDAKILTFENTPKELYEQVGTDYIPRDNGDGIEIAKYARDNGYDAVEYYSPKELKPEMSVVNPEVLKPKEGIGPGAAKEDSREFDPDIERLTEVVQQMPRDSSFEDRTSVADTVKKEFTGALAKTKTAWTGFKQFSAAAWDWYTRPPQWTDFQDAFGKYDGARQISRMKVGRWAKEIQDSMPPRKQVGISNYIRAGGDEATLREWSEKTTDPEVKRGYEDALTLTDTEKEFANDVHRYWDRKLDECIEEDVLEHGVENYVRQVLTKDPKNENAKKLLNRATSGALRQNPSFAKKQIFHNFFEGEQEGYRYEKRIGYLISEYQWAFDEAVNARRFVREQISKMDATDGRPMLVTMGVGKPIFEKEKDPVTGEMKPKDIPSAFLIRPEAVSESEIVTTGNRKRVTEINKWLKEHPEASEERKVILAEKEKLLADTSDYKTIPNAYALKNMKWATKDSEGKPIFVEGDVKIHPEAYGQLNSMLGRSLIQDYEIAGIKPGKLALKGSSTVKGTLLGFFSTFHQTHIGVRLMTRNVSPFSADAIDLNDTVTKDLIEHNLKVYDGNPMSMFRQGYEGPGLIKFIPKVGKWAEQYTEYLFGLDGYIPRVKVKLAKEFFDRNTEHYPKLSRDQVLKLSSEQANAAIGGQNWEAMGMSKTAQDLMRLGGLAPDFLISSWRAKGQAFKPYGREQFAAIAIRGTIMLYATAKIIEGIASMVDDKNEVHWDRPFSVTIDDTEYSVRSEQGDIYHAIRDPRGFIYNRLNPAIVKPAIEYLTGRDRFGRKRDTLEVLQDWATGAVPIAGQGYFTKDDYNLYQSVLQSIGISSWDAELDAEKMIKELKQEQAEMTKKQKEELEKAMGPEARKAMKKMKRFTIRPQQ
jgi:hypothetical protein